ncbi:hypothetical protein M513_01004 [Trichuris suis]|uniref:Uncharacterized protein n=1 Tax=Trichuris suis TaxID=68888 RepID=A0A085MLZ5_9BILA|nr:hypothetical protein M513_01004 [Trichuris suis]
MSFHESEVHRYEKVQFLTTLLNICVCISIAFILADNKTKTEVKNITPRHVRDLRRRPHSEEAGNKELQADDQDDDLVIYFPGQDAARPEDLGKVTGTATDGLRRSARVRKPRVLDCCDH